MIVIVDASIWIDHLHRGDIRLQQLLDSDAASMHPFVLAEIALGSLRDRTRLLVDLATLPRPEVASSEDVLALIERERLFSTGLAHTDTHLIASALLSPPAKVWTRDRRFQEAVERLGVAYAPA